VARAFLLILAGLMVPGILPAARAEGENPAPEEESPEAKARAEAIEAIRKDLKRLALSPRAPEKKPEIFSLLESLETLAGPAAATAALEALPLEDDEVRARAFGLVERERPKGFAKRLAALLEEKRYRRDADLKERVAHAFSVLADAAALEHLASLVQDEAATVVAAAADAMATFGSAPHRQRVEPVKRLVDLYESTWNLMNSIRPEDRVISGVMRDRWEVYGKAVRAALQALTGRQDITRPHEFRRWWNDHKKRTDW
jgi:hypothetical protein